MANDALQQNEPLGTASHSGPSATFEYRPLEPRCIRILELQPGVKGDALEGRLIVMNVDDEDGIVYDALSYQWNDPAPAAVLSLSGKLLPLAANLATALQHLRCVDKTLVIWIDAICINQKNLNERAEQVQMMRHIFTYAETVRIWINEPDVDETNEAFVALRDFYDAPDSVVHELWPDLSFWEPVMPIFTNSYWNRVWIQQEVLNARKLFLHCMDMVIPGASIARFQEAFIEWNHLYSVVQPWRENSSPATIFEKDIFTAPASRWLRLYQTGQKSQRLIFLLYMSDTLAMTDQRDRVYALMQLASDYEDGAIDVSYLKTALDTLVDATAYHVATNLDLDFLCDSYLRKDRVEAVAEDTEEVNPTWLPLLWQGHERIANPCGYLNVERLMTTCLPDSVNVASKLLRLRGFKIDVVDQKLLQNLIWATTTVQEFWETPLGTRLRHPSSGAFESLAQDMFRVFAVRDYGDTLPTHEAMQSTLFALYALSQNEGTANMTVLDCMSTSADVLENVDISALHELGYALARRTVLLTESQRIVLIPDCAVAVGDEIWVAMGADLPLVVRPQSNGNYCFVCMVYVPGVLDIPGVREFTSEAEPGDQVGQWTVSDINLK